MIEYSALDITKRCHPLFFRSYEYALAISLKTFDYIPCFTLSGSLIIGSGYAYIPFYFAYTLVFIRRIAPLIRLVSAR